jgi:methionine-rich copper-binding protein CopC
MTRYTTFAAVAALALVSAASEASAHAKLVKSDPTANAAVAAPKTITLKFNEELAPAFSKLELGMADGMKIKVKTTVSKDHKSLIGTPDGKLTPGAYTVTWQAAAVDDGHKTNGTVPFTIK